MEYTVQKLGKLAGVSTRTLRYYDEIGLLKPARINSSGYRLYGEKETDRLQLILFYRELHFELDQIRKILDAGSFDPLKALMEHRTTLIQRKQQMDLLIDNVEKTIAMMQGGKTMTDDEKFEGFKDKLIQENEQKYGVEIREKYGEEEVYQANKKMKNMSKDQHMQLEALSLELNNKIKEAFLTGNPSGETAQKACALHKQWIMFFWNHYSKEMHKNLVQMYVDDPRFTAYYDKIAPGSAVFLRDAMEIYLG